MIHRFELTVAENGFIVASAEKTAVVQGKDSPINLGEAIFSALGIESKTLRKTRGENKIKKTSDRLNAEELPI